MSAQTHFWEVDSAGTLVEMSAAADARAKEELALDRAVKADGRAEVRLAYSLEKFVQGSFLTPSDVPGYLLGLVEGFYVDGEWGTVMMVWEVGKISFRYSPLGYLFTDTKTYQEDWQAVQAGAGLAWSAAMSLTEFQVQWRLELGRIALAAARGRSDEVAQRLQGLDSKARDLLGVAAEFAMELLDQASNLGPREKGRATGMILYAAAETVLIETLTAGVATPAVVAKFLKMVRAIPGLDKIPEAKFAAAAAKLEKALAGLSRAGKAAEGWGRRPGRWPGECRRPNARRRRRGRCSRPRRRRRRWHRPRRRRRWGRRRRRRRLS
jgi:hypothetical protein